MTHKQKERAADELVRTLYSRLDDEKLTEILEVGRKYPPIEYVILANAAIERELERRKNAR